MFKIFHISIIFKHNKFLILNILEYIFNLFLKKIQFKKMRNNKNDRNIMKRLDTSNESHKYSYKKNNEKDKKNKNESKYLLNMNRKINNSNNIIVRLVKI